jgi:RNA polymerase sigma factor for flagellar operon FliA
MPSPPPPDLKALLVEHHDFIDSVVRTVAGRNHLSASDADDLRQTVELKLVERDYDVLRRFEGRSSLRTYLRVVIERCFLDQRTAAWGKWRPSAQARRLGPVAVLLERALVRDRLTYDAAVASLRAQHRVAASDAELATLHEALPLRVRRHRVADDEADDLASPAPDQHEALATASAGQAGNVAEMAMARTLGLLEPEERVLFRLHFLEGMKLSHIARLLGWEQKPLYRRLHRVLAALRRELEASGITGEQVDALVRLSDFDLARVLEASGDMGISGAGPSSQSEMHMAPGKRRTVHG